MRRKMRTPRSRQLRRWRRPHRWQKKAPNNEEETNKQNEILLRLQAEIHKHSIDGILSFTDAWIRQYIHYFFKKKVMNLSKTKKENLKVILSPLLEHHYALIQTTADLIADMSTGDSATPSANSVKEV